MNQTLVLKLKQWIEPLSVNQLKGISPTMLKRNLKVDDRELKEFVEFLHKERILTYRYKFKCIECGNDCISYDRQLRMEKYTCSECEKTIVFADIVKKCEVTYEINKEEVLRLNVGETIDFTKSALNTSIINLDTCKRKLEGENKMEKKTIFFGSSSEAADIMDEVAAVVGANGFSTLKWNSPNANIFIAGQNTIDNLIKATERVDAAIFIFNDDDKTWFNDSMESRTVRDNVLFEYGLFMGKLGKTKVAIASKNDPHIASDLKGITYIDLNGDESVWGQNLKAWLNQIK